MAAMGVRQWVVSWLAFTELRGTFDHTTEQYSTLGKDGWFTGLGIFGSPTKRIAERVAASPHCFCFAYSIGGDPYIDGKEGMIHPDRVAAVLAARKGVEESALFPEYTISDGIIQFNLERGLNALKYDQNAVALKRLTLAAEQGNPTAQFALGRMYAEGVNAPLDHLLAHKWLNLATYRLSGADREQALTLRATVTKAMSPDLIAEAETLARQWTPKTWDELTKEDTQADSIP